MKTPAPTGTDRTGEYALMLSLMAVMGLLGTAAYLLFF